MSILIPRLVLPDFDPHAAVVEVDIVDTLTGEAGTVEGYNVWFWTEGNGSCDCNRPLAFGPLGLDCPGVCAGAARYRITAVRPMPPGYTLADFNANYPGKTP